MSCPFKKYSNIFGEPNTGIHSTRVFNLAINDIISTIVGAAVISYFIKANFWVVLLILFLLGIILHRLFDVKTTIDKLIFGI